MNNFKKISELLAQKAEEVAQYLLPAGKKMGYEWCVGSIDGDSGESLKVHLNGKKAGVWADFATDQKGDLLDLWALVRAIPLFVALKEAEKYLGMYTPIFEAHKSKIFERPLVAPKPIIPASAVMQYLINERMLTHETLSAFKIGEQNREIIFYFYREGELILVKYLSLDRIVSDKNPLGKKQIRAESNCEPCLFGWQALPPNTRKITLTEGELDAMSLHQYGHPALSVPFGGGKGKKQEWIEYEFDRLAAFDEIFICIEKDKSGITATDEIIERLGRHRCRIVNLPYKDANECLQKGVPASEIQKCFDEATTFDPVELKPANFFINQVIEEFYPKENAFIGYYSPWQYAKGKIFFRPDELSIWTGINGHGKSQLLGHVILALMAQGARICIASLEIKPKKLLMRLTRQAAGLREPSIPYIKAIHEWYNDKLWLFDLVGVAKVDRLLEVFLYARQRYGVDVFVIDSLMKLDIADDDYVTQKILFNKLCDFKNQYNCQIHIIAHPRKSEDEYKIPSKLDVKGAGSITDLADNCFTVWRNKSKEEIIQIIANGKTQLDAQKIKKLDECDCIWRCDKQRNGEWEGKIALWFDKESLQYLGHQNQKAIQFVEYSS